ncbi:MAG: alkyl hydroperoxide reductase/thiol specificantioxidant/mal allergen [Bacteroidetes bacterium]|nr:alkyl hydroperoxide reductase/thiol specificantioxidant/mal allergen [Bacteroidota bacterium]
MNDSCFFTSFAKHISSNRLMKKHQLFVFVAFLLTAVQSFAINPPLSAGRWRAEFISNQEKFPFVFDVKVEDASSTIVLINGEERVPLSGLTYKNDTLTVPIEAFDAELKGVVRGDVFEGKFIKHYIENDPGIPFVAKKTTEPRFPKVFSPTAISAAGKWDVQFVSANGEVEKNVGVFNQKSGIVTGSFLTNSGDLRFLEGTLTENGFTLSAFSGLSPYLVKIQFEGNDTFTGEFHTTRGTTKLIGLRNENAKLDDPYSLTVLKEDNSKLNFSLPDIDGKAVSINDPEYKGKVVVVSILGSWCPNCLDEMKYLVPWYKQNKKRGVEIIGLAFERKEDPAYAKRVLSLLRDRYGVEYKILFGGKVGGQATSKVLPQLSKIISYPTMIFIDKKGNVSKIHTGFNGPATGKFYEEFKDEFNQTIDELLRGK